MEVYTSIEGLKLKNKFLKSYKDLGTEYSEWIEETTIDLLKKRNIAELKAKKYLLEICKHIDEQPFFRINNRAYFLDFFIPAYNIAIEIDGGYHKHSKEHDRQRDCDFNNIGIKTIRFKAEKVLKEGISIEDIKKALLIKRKKKKKKRTKQYSINEPTIIKKARKRLKEHDKKKYNARWI